MAELEEQLSQMLKDPNIMQQVAAMAQSFGFTPQKGQEPEAASPPVPSPDMLQRLSHFAAMPMLDKNQKGLLAALSPYLSQEKARKLENAMTIAHLATMASTIFPGGGQNV